MNGRIVVLAEHLDTSALSPNPNALPRSAFFGLGSLAHVFTPTRVSGVSFILSLSIYIRIAVFDGFYSVVLTFIYAEYHALL